MPTAEELVQMTLTQWNYDQDHRDRLDLYKEYEAYYDGDFADEAKKKLQILSPRVRQALQCDFKVIANYAKTVVNKAVGYLCSDPIALEAKADLFGLDGDEKKEARDKAKAVAKEAERLLYRVYRDNGFLQKQIVKLLRLQGKKGDVFVKCWMDSNDKEHPIHMTVLKPDIVFPKWNSDNYEECEYIAIVFTKYDEKGMPYKFAQVWWPDQWKEYEMRTNQTTWSELQGGRNEIGIIPIVHIKNMEDEKPWGESDIEIIKTLVDAICKAFTDLMVNADYQAFQRVIMTGHEDYIDENPDQAVKDEIEEKDKQKTGPGTMLAVAEPEAKVYTVEPADPQGLINIVKTIREEISAHGRIPQIALSQADGAGAASSLSLRIHYQPLDEKCSEKAMLAANGLQAINQIIFAFHALNHAGEDFRGIETEVRFQKSLPVDQKEQTDILDIQIRDKVKSRKTAMQEIGIDDADDERAQIQEEDQLYSTDIYGQRLNADIDALLNGGQGDQSANGNQNPNIGK